jgi:acetyl-CoA carboxylase/biotin carboxylase 1
MAPATNGVNGHKASASRSWQDKHDLPAHFIGGNKLSAAPPSAVKEFVAQSDGHSVITSVSIRRDKTEGSY